MKRFIYSLLFISQIFSIVGLPAMLPGQGSVELMPGTNDSFSCESDTEESLSQHPQDFSRTPEPQKRNDDHQNTKITPVHKIASGTPISKKRKRKAQHTQDDGSTKRVGLDLQGKPSATALFPVVADNEVGSVNYVEEVLDAVLETFVQYGDESTPCVVLSKLFLKVDKNGILSFNGDTKSPEEAFIFMTVLRKFIDINFDMHSIAFDGDGLKEYIKSDTFFNFIEKFIGKNKSQAIKAIKKKIGFACDSISKLLKALGSVKNSNFELNIMILVFNKLEILLDRLNIKFDCDLIKKDSEYSFGGKKDFKNILRDVVTVPFAESFLRMSNTDFASENITDFIQELCKCVNHIKKSVVKDLSNRDEYRFINLVTCFIVKKFKGLNSDPIFFNEKTKNVILLDMLQIFNRIYKQISKDVLFEDKDATFIASYYLPLLVAAYKIFGCFDLKGQKDYKSKLDKFILLSSDHLIDPIYTLNNKGKPAVQGGHFLFTNEYQKNGDSFKFNNKSLINGNCKEVMNSNGQRYLVDSFKILYNSGNTLFGYWLIKNEQTGENVAYKISTACEAGNRKSFYEFVAKSYQKKKQMIGHSRGKKLYFCKDANLRFMMIVNEMNINDFQEDVQIKTIITFYPFLHSKNAYVSISVTDNKFDGKSIDDNGIKVLPSCFINDFLDIDLNAVKIDLKKYLEKDILIQGFDDYKNSGSRLIYESDRSAKFRCYLPVSKYSYVKEEKEFIKKLIGQENCKLLSTPILDRTGMEEMEF